MLENLLLLKVYVRHMLYNLVFHTVAGPAAWN